MKPTLSIESVITVEGVRYSDWIPPLKAYGPLRKCSIKLKDVINLLNNDIDVVLRDDQNEDLYLFVKQYNEKIKILKNNAPLALRCEEILYERVYKKAIKIEKEENKENPFIAEDEDDFDISAENILLTAKNTSSNMKDPLKDIRKNNKIVKPHSYDIFASTTEEPSLIQKLDEANNIMEYGNIDFEI